MQEQQKQQPDATKVEVTLTPPGTDNTISLGSMPPDEAMALLDLLRDAGGLVLRPDGNGQGEQPGISQKLPLPTGYVVVMDAARPGHLTVRLTFEPRSFSDLQNGDDDLGLPGGDSHSGPASLTLVLDHWADEHGYRFVHTAEQLNQPIDDFVEELGPEDRHRVVVAIEEGDDGGLVRIGEALPSGEIVEVAALSTDWLASLPRGL